MSLGMRPVSNPGFPFWILSGSFGDVLQSGETTFHKIPIKVASQKSGMAIEALARPQVYCH